MLDQYSLIKQSSTIHVTALVENNTQLGHPNIIAWPIDHVEQRKSDPNINFLPISTVAHFSVIRNTGKKAKSLHTILALNNYHNNCPAAS